MTRSDKEKKKRSKQKIEKKRKTQKGIGEFSSAEERTRGERAGKKLRSFEVVVAHVADVRIIIKKSTEKYSLSDSIEQ